jgi:hypothetical protein
VIIWNPLQSITENYNQFEGFNNNRNILKIYSTFVIQSAKHVGIPPVGSLVMANTYVGIPRYALNDKSAVDSLYYSIVISHFFVHEI